MGSVRAGTSWRPRRRGGLRAIAAFAAAVAVSSCASVGSVGGTSTGPAATAPGRAAAASSAAGQAGGAPATPAPPFPAIAPVSRDAGWNPESSRHWVGYTFPAQNVTGVRAEWTEPTVTGRAGDEEFVWIGIGGWNQTGSNIIQAGTFVYFPGGGQTNEGVWYQRVPENQKAIFPLVGVGPGDHIYASVVLLPGGRWRMAVDDVSSGSAFSIALPFQSLGAYPSFVVEDPDSGPLGDAGPFFPLPRWGSVAFSNVQVRVRRSWVAAAALPAIQISMVRDGNVLATAGPLSRQSSFSVVQS
jgi:Peptidase A4 family